MIKFIFLFLLSFANFSYAQENPFLKVIKPVFFGLPIDCQVGQECWVMNYVDMGMDDNQRIDPFCLQQTYDGHKGTDFTLLDGAAMERGVDVLAAADGTISRLRDGEKDGWHLPSDLEEIKNNQKECGNGIFIDHGDGVQTIYCHLKLNSITVKRGQAVKKGDKIAQVGQSGMTEFPHLHFGIIKDGKVLDPFTGQSHDEECGKTEKPLWDEGMEIGYSPLVIQSIGFLDQVPDFKQIEKQVPVIGSISGQAEAFVFWMGYLGAREGDRIIMEIKDPNGKIFARREIEQDKTRTRQYYFTGKKMTDEPLVEGAYTGEVKIIRDDKTWYKAIAVLVSQ